MDHLTVTEAEILGIVHEAWLDVQRGVAKGEGEFSRLNAKGITRYQFKVPKIKASRGRMQEIRTMFISNIREKQKANPLYRMGLRLKIAELLDHSESYAAQQPQAGKPPESSGHLTSLPVLLQDLGASPRRSKRITDGEIALYKQMSAQLNEAGFKSRSDPSEFFLLGSYTGRGAVTNAAVLLTLAYGNKEGMERKEIIYGVEAWLPQFGAYARDKSNIVDTCIAQLIECEVLEKIPISVHKYRYKISRRDFIRP